MCHNEDSVGYSVELRTKTHCPQINISNKVSFVTLLHLMFKWDFVGNVVLRAMRPCSLFLSLLSLLWHCCTWCSNETLLEMLIWGQWVFVLYSWVSWCFCDTVAPDVQMRLCWKCWFEGNEYLFLILESPESFVTLLHLMFKWDFVRNVVLRAMRPCSLFLSLLSLLWHCCSFEHQVQQCHKSIRRLRNKEQILIALKSAFPTKSHWNIRCNSVTKD